MLEETEIELNKQKIEIITCSENLNLHRTSKVARVVPMQSHFSAERHEKVDWPGLKVFKATRIILSAYLPFELRTEA